MKLDIEGKVALVVASSKGIGRACGMALAMEGVKLVICARDKDALTLTKDEIYSATGAEILAISADLSDANDIEMVLEETLIHFGNLHILVTNSGGPQPGQFLELNDADWEEALQLLLMSNVRLIRAALPQMRKNQWGRIINITSIAVREPIENLILSNAIRASVHGVAKTLSREMGCDGITINNIMPGYINTARMQEIVTNRARLSGQSEAEIISASTSNIPVRRVGFPEEIGHLVAFLASEKASYISGTSIPVDGGMLKSIS